MRQSISVFGYSVRSPGVPFALMLIAAVVGCSYPDIAATHHRASSPREKAVASHQDCENGLFEESNGDNVALPPEELVEQQGPGPYWLPSESMMRDSRPRIAWAMQFCRGSERTFEELMRYDCQFVGSERGGERLLHAECTSFVLCAWHTVNDGNDNVIYATVRAEDGRVLEISIGGPATCGSDEDGALRFDTD